MRIKRYVAATMEEALQQVKEDLGRHAIILQTQKIRPLFGIFGRTRVEVVAATDATLQVASDGRAEPVPIPVPRAAARAYEGVTRILPEQGETTQRPSGTETTVMKTEPEPAPAPAPAPSTTHQDDLLAMGFQLSTISRLLAGGVEPGDDVFVTRLREMAAQWYPRRGMSQGKPARTIALVGATGSGKTTTLARLAARAVSQDKKISLITMDTQRVGAVEQLRSFSEILQAQFFVAHDGEALKEALERSGSSDLVLIDTAGRAPNDALALGQLRQALERVELDETHLVMPVNTRLPDARRMYRVYRSLRPNRLILTKLDETQALGGLLEIPQQVPLTVSYLTYGQRIPEDMEQATPEAVARLVVAGLQALQAGRSAG